ncbi:MAG TPA: DUF1097 domain-containing protein [Candidatus Copromorpha excrementigallinarum]|uniref:DUF1097 domain-containing protein n=1 Tax=Candidatus Allocopromorpha excrementigallinarum TaxID=2840742 RepID=A0A9D1I3W9_9FIRM|nr:DUF1097 domain-containing protein [Candidatus Copromorpha excrementigallinarum]
MKEMKPRIPIEVVVGVLGGLSCIVTISGLGLPVWALFIGWAWYFALGAQPSAFKQIVPAVFPGALLAALCLWLMEVFTGFGFTGLPNMIVFVAITVFLLMCALRIPICNASLPAFNAYSSVFALYSIGGFPDLAIGPILSCCLWAVIGNLLGPVFGWLSIVLQFPKEVEKTEDKEMIQQ